MAHVFISYVRDNSTVVDRLVNDLKRSKIDVWKDRENIYPGVNWKIAIKSAIQSGQYFIACFSKEFHSRTRTHMREELNIAIEELRLRPQESKWFIPVLIDDTDIPLYEINPTYDLNHIQAVEMFDDWNDGIRRILSVVGSNNPNVPKYTGTPFLTQAKIVEQEIYDRGEVVRINAEHETGIPIGLSFYPGEIVQREYPFDNFHFSNSATGEEENIVELVVQNFDLERVDMGLRERLSLAYHSSKASSADKALISRWLVLLNEGNSVYVRLSAVETMSDKHRPNNTMRLIGAPARFSMGFQSQIEEMFARLGINLPNAESMLQRNLLAVRAAVIRRSGRNNYVVFQQRSENNYLFPMWLDVGACGYVNFEFPKDRSDKYLHISIVDRARKEIAEELQLNDLCIPHSEEFAFFGLTRVAAVGHLDVICQCVIDSDAFEREFRVLPKGRVVAVRDDVPLDPSSIVNFLLRREHGACDEGGRVFLHPSALVTLVCMLRRAGYTLDVISEEFHQLAGRLELDPQARGPFINS